MDQNDIFAEQASLQRRRSLLDAMMKQSSESPIVGNTGLGQALAKIATAYMGNKAGGNLDRELAQNQRAYGGQLGQAVDAYLKSRNGSPGTPGEMGTVGDYEGLGGSMTPATPATPPNPREAIVNAMTSRFPELQAVGKQELANLGRQEAETFQNPVPAIKNGQSVMVQYGNRGTERVVPGTLPPMNGIAANGQVIDQNNPNRPPVDVRDKFGPVKQVAMAPGGTPILGATADSGKVEFAPTGQTINIDNVGAKDALSQAPKVLEAARTTFMEAGQQRQRAEQIIKLARDPQVASGFGAGLQAGLQSLGAKVGITGPDAATKTQALMSQFAQDTLAHAKEVYPVSNNDIKFLEKATSGGLEYTPAAIEHLAHVALTLQHNRQLSALEQYKSATGVKGVDEIAKLYPLPPVNFTVPQGPGYTALPGDRVQYNNPAFNPAEAPASAPVVRNW